jgi:rubrerythrin
VLNTINNQNKKLSRSGRKIKIPKWLQNSEELETSVSEMDDLETPVSSHENIHLDESMDKNQSTVSMTTRSTTEQQIDGVGALRPNETREIDEFECRKCDLKMETVLERLRHEVTVHDYIDYIGYHRNKSFECPICKTHRKSEKSIKLHIHNRSHESHQNLHILFFLHVPCFHHLFSFSQL